ncbi:MAG: alpha/beta fold hydrolase [Planctomycetota bacterium]|nr:alpha/beta fold hydrolase [Planctomycetota bacterium]
MVSTLRCRTIFTALLISLLGAAASVHAQSTKTAPSKLPPPVEMTLDTSDGVPLAATYWAGTNKKDTVPVVLLHMYKGSRADFKTLPLLLQQQGHAVLAVDLRGHGKSTSVKRGAREEKVDQATLRKADFEAMLLDMEAVKKFLLAENNEGKLNIRKLCVIGAEMGATVAVKWAMLDWRWPVLTTGPQGQDVQALVLLTPDPAFKGIPLRDALAFPPIQSGISMMIVAGSKDNANFRDAKRIHQGLERFRPAPPANEAEAKQNLYFVPLNTSLQGTKMLGERNQELERSILKFIDLRLVKNPTDPWSERKNPLK